MGSFPRPTVLRNKQKKSIFCPNYGWSAEFVQQSSFRQKAHVHRSKSKESSPRSAANQLKDRSTTAAGYICKDIQKDYIIPKPHYEETFTKDLNKLSMNCCKLCSFVCDGHCDLSPHQHHCSALCLHSCISLQANIFSPMLISQNMSLSPVCWVRMKCAATLQPAALSVHHP